MCAISPKVQCPHCLTYWTKGIVYCTCGSCSRPTDETRQMNRDRFDTQSIPHQVIKKGPPHGARHGNTERQRICHTAHIAFKRTKKKGYKSILDRFQNCPIHRESQLAIGWDEASCANFDDISNEDHTYVYTADEHKRLETSWVLQLNSQGPNSPMKQRDDYADAVKVKDRLYRESGGTNPKIHPSRQVR